MSDPRGAFIFRLVSDSKIVKANVKRDQDAILHNGVPDHLPSFYDCRIEEDGDGHIDNASGFFEIPDNFDHNFDTFWAGASNFSLKEMEIYQVIPSFEVLEVTNII